MTPPPAASTAARASSFAPTLKAPTGASSIVARLLDGRSWARLRNLTDVIVLYLASSAALFAASALRQVTEDRWIAACFPLLVIALMRARRGPDDRLSGSLLDSCAHVVGVVSLGAMLTIAFDSIIGGVHPLGLALRLWLFSVVYLGVARVVLLSVRRQAVRIEALATPTLVIGAGVVGDHLVKRLLDEPRY
jgi:FlaA1/EpsC-like NDP-sugar epimerase